MSSVAPAIAPSVLLGRSVALPSYGRPDRTYTNVSVIQPLSAGLVSLHTLPGAQFEILQQVTFTWQASAVVGVRTVGVVFHDANGDVIGQVLAPGQQSEGTSARYTFALDATAAAVPNVFYTGPLPYMILSPTQSWQLFGSGLDSGDVQDGLTHTEIVIPTGPPLTAAAPAPVVTPVLV